MRSVLLAASLFLSAGAPVADAQVLPPAQRVTELAYRVVPELFAYPADRVVGEASGVAVNSKGHIFLFQPYRPQLSPAGKVLLVPGWPTKVKATPRWDWLPWSAWSAPPREHSQAGRSKVLVVDATFMVQE